MLARKTQNGNYLVYDKESLTFRFVTSEGKHIRWVEDDEADYLSKVMELEEYQLFPELATPPEVIRVWQHVVPPERPDLSNNGGSYANLYRIEELKGWGGSVDGFRLVTNHLYGSDFEEQGWNVERYFDSHTEMYEYIENFKVPV